MVLDFFIFFKKYADDELALERNKQKEFNSDLNSIAREKYISQEQKSTLRNIIKLYKAQESVIDFFTIILQLYV